MPKLSSQRVCIVWRSGHMLCTYRHGDGTVRSFTAYDLGDARYVNTYNELILALQTEDKIAVPTRLARRILDFNYIAED